MNCPMALPPFCGVRGPASISSLAERLEVGSLRPVLESVPTKLLVHFGS